MLWRNSTDTDTNKVILAKFLYILDCLYFVNIY
jgi:hypothetical protein